MLRRSAAEEREPDQHGWENLREGGGGRTQEKEGKSAGRRRRTEDGEEHTVTKPINKNRVGPPPILVAVEFNWECAAKIGGGPTRFFDVFFFSIYFLWPFFLNGSHGCGIAC